MISIRHYTTADLEPLYAICLATGDRGQDATRLYAHAELIGHLYAGPYGLFQPDLAVIAEDSDGVVGYAVSVTDTVAWEELLEQSWWPTLRERYTDPGLVSKVNRTADQSRAAIIHRPQTVPMAVAGPYPAHLHMNLLPRGRGKGTGAALFEAWARLASLRGAKAAHIGANRNNRRAVRFWGKLGFTELALDPTIGTRTVWMGRAL